LLAPKKKHEYTAQLLEKMSSLNKWLGLGNLTADPQREEMPIGPVATFVMAINERFVKSGVEQKQSTTFIRVVAPGKLGESVLAHLRKSRQVLVEGKLHIQHLEEGGKKFDSASIWAENIQFLGESGRTEKPGDARLLPEH
jgi:single stranded DNA-binding protein